MAATIKILPHYTYQEYKIWEGKWELIEGIPYAMSPAPTPLHQLTSMALGAEFRAALRDKKCHCNIYQPLDYKISEDTVVQPDLLILCKKPTEVYIDFAPSLLVEILSTSTAHKDRITKYELYQQEKIPYYIIVDVNKKEVEVYILNKNGQYEQKLHNNTFTFQLDNDCNIEVNFSSIWD